MSRTALYAAAISLALICTPVWSNSAYAEKRVALVIGNSAYQNTPALPNPAKDARAVAAKFKEAGYDVNVYYDLGNLAFKRRIREFEASDADVIVVYYAGHGIEIGGTNYVIPVDAKLASTRDAPDEAIPLERLLEAVDGAKRLSLVILDACRDNPFVQMKRPRTAALRSINAGLSPVEPTSTNTLIAYATKTGTSAEDGTSEHSPFTAALLKHLFVQGLDVRLAFGRVRDEVLKDTGKRQEPYVTGSIGGESIAVVPATQVASIDPNVEGVKSDYQLVEQIGTERAWQVFLNQHPDGYYAELAKAQIAKLIVATIENNRVPWAPEPTSEEQRAWDRIKESSNAAWLRDFIKRYPTSPLANTAQTRLDAIEREAKEREEKARLEREAKAAEEARQRAERAEALRRARRRTQGQGG